MIADLLRHAEARRVLKRVGATPAERRAARRVLGLTPPVASTSRLPKKTLG